MLNGKFKKSLTNISFIEKQKILLIPPVINPFTKLRKESFIPLGLLSLASTLEQNNIGVQIYKPHYRLIKEEDYRTVAHDILKYKTTFIGFSTWCISYPAMLLLAREIKTIQANSIIIFGGPQASILPKETMSSFPYIDYILVGEADYTLPEFVRAISSSTDNLPNIAGLFYRNAQGEVCRNKILAREIVPNTLPIPLYKLIQKTKTIKLDVGRGCPYKCTYCSTNNFFSKKYRVKSADRILEEMQLIYDERGVKQFSFAHDMFTLDKPFILELCKKLISQRKESNLDFTWTCSARIDCVSADMLIEMKKAGCEAIFFGIESGSKKIQKSIGKNLRISKAYEIADLCQKINLNMHVSYILGFPDETEQDIEDTLRSLLLMGTMGVYTQVSQLSLLPGTPLFKKHYKELRFDGRFSNFSQTICGVNEMELITQYPNIFSSFYYLPVKPINRDELDLLSRLINKQGQFINTLFLLSKLIKTNLKDKNLLSLIKSEIENIRTNKEINNTITSHWISVIKKFIRKSHIQIAPIVYDTFAYEAYVALLLEIYTRWQLINTEKIKGNFSGNFRIRPTIIWKILTTSHKLERIIPSENKWKSNNTTIRKGSYKYLLVASSEVKCKRYKLTKKEAFLLENLDELTITEFYNKIKEFINEEELICWLKKMHRRRVLDTIILTN